MSTEHGDFEWKKYGACQGMAQKRRSDGKVIDFFYDTFEEDESVRSDVLAICASCPVIDNCKIAGREGKESGVWGGEYLENGYPVQGN